MSDYVSKYLKKISEYALEYGFKALESLGLGKNYEFSPVLAGTGERNYFSTYDKIDVISNAVFKRKRTGGVSRKKSTNRTRKTKREYGKKHPDMPVPKEHNIRKTRKTLRNR